VVARQLDAGIDVVNDGEQGKASYALYVKDRVEGFEDAGETTLPADSLDYRDFPDFAAGQKNVGFVQRPACVGPVTWKDWNGVQRDIDLLK
jgi:5-methyltetrahydropteroyltriglutamate--homocysteine methyltransferase